ncbi:WYL domain-containing protein [Lentzea sp. NBRC 102530]|uniref:helix-turn-helix transcriptional regulator n=1 Tax=Lentzea sp. NBRC 102530 TaxID=3032201 RepID=UPI0024A4474F|nr:WYL domain-containing protein [Lentzea sp. NBRC 102530]GLY50603.1 transcriptional regulator [Lentzea sp. NBRC 102530]
MKSDRLLSILLLLQTHGQLSAADLAARLEVSARTIMRDFEALSAAGVPVYTVRGPQGGIALLPGYHTDVTGLTADESRALFVVLAGSAHADLGLGQALGSALRKVMAALPAPHQGGADLTSRRVLIDPVRWRGSPGASDLEVYQRAVFADRRLRLRYRHGRDNRVRTYTVDPYGLVNKAGVWYLVADHQGEPHLYRLDRARSAVVVAEPVRRRAGVELDDAWEALRRRIDDLPSPVAVTALVRDDVLALFLRMHEGDLDGPPVPRDPGWNEVRVRFRSLRAVETLLAFGAGVEVLSPDAARDALAAQAKAIADLYAVSSAPRPGTPAPGA